MKKRMGQRMVVTKMVKGHYIITMHKRAWYTAKKGMWRVWNIIPSIGWDGPQMTRAYHLEGDSLENVKANIKREIAKEITDALTR